jgi:hypothetical protein
LLRAQLSQDEEDEKNVRQQKTFVVDLNDEQSLPPLSARFLFRRLLEVFIGTNIVLALVQQWIIPSVVNSLIPFSVSCPIEMHRYLRQCLSQRVHSLSEHGFLQGSGENSKTCGETTSLQLRTV